MPTKQSQVKAAPLAIPELGKDSAERKRVLNVLAQRRYRQRRKEHIRKLEAQAVVVETAETTPSPNGHLQDTTQEAEHDQAPIEGRQPQCPFAATHLYPFDNEEVMLVDPLEAQPPAVPGDPFASIITNDQACWDTSILLPSLPSTPLSTSRHSSSGESEDWLLVPPVATESPREWPRTLRPPAFAAEDTTYSFPDEAYLEMTELTLLRGCMAIARRLDIQDIIWSLTGHSPFTNPAMALAEFNHLPANLRPTLVQMTIPHHPVIDLLPWPSARNRMIKVLTQPPEFRPPGAASPMALLDFVYDIEDSAEGVRISGNDPYCGDNWEVGEKVFKSWWWVFDRDIIRRSNELRVSRGAPLLGGSVLGEIV